MKHVETIFNEFFNAIFVLLQYFSIFFLFKLKVGKGFKIFIISVPSFSDTKIISKYE